ncbi:uncharacterized protein LOC144112937 [Amblyomma americanum]
MSALVTRVVREYAGAVGAHVRAGFAVSSPPAAVTRRQFGSRRSEYCRRTFFDCPPPHPRRSLHEPVSLAVHVGSQIDLPCKSLLANDLPLRINWFKDDSPMPVYSVTYASNQSFHRTNIMQGRHAARSDWSQRAYFSVLGSPATLKVNDLSFQDTGTYVCQVVISRGTQRNATVHLVVVEPPEPLHNCQICNLTETSLGVTCWTGHGSPDAAHGSAGLNTTYVLELYSSQQASQVLNVSGSQPVFSVRNLQPRTEYFIVLYGVNSLGHSNAVKLYASTLTSAEALLDTEHAWNVLGLGVYSSILIVVLVILCLVLLVLAFVVNRWRKKHTLREAGDRKKTCLATIDRNATVRKETYDADEEEVSVLDIKGLPTAASAPFGASIDEGASYVRETASIAGRLPCHTTDMYYTLPQLHSRHNGIRLQTFSREVM